VVAVYPSNTTLDQARVIAEERLGQGRGIDLTWKAQSFWITEVSPVVIAKVEGISLTVGTSVRMDLMSPQTVIRSHHMHASYVTFRDRTSA
jgi:hypothetical protein